jgi:hypothetical protein
MCCLTKQQMQFADLHHMCHCSNWILEQQWLEQQWGSPLLVRMFLPLWLVNATNLPIGAVVVATQPQPQNKEAKEEGGSIHGGMQTAAKSSTLRVMETRPKPA